MEAYVADARLAQPEPGIAKKHARPTRQHNRYDRRHRFVGGLFAAGLAGDFRITNQGYGLPYSSPNPLGRLKSFSRVAHRPAEGVGMK